VSLRKAFAPSAPAPARSRRAAARADAFRLTAAEWRQLLYDAETVARYHDKVYRRGPGRCWPWLGAISDSGHPKLRAGTRVLVPGRPGTRVVSALAFGWQVSRGPLPRTADGQAPVIRHRCDSSGCCNPSHWITGTKADNARDYQQRVTNPLSPLNDTRGPAGRARAIRDAILAAIRAGASAEEIEREITRAEQRGMTGEQGTLWP
jgi:hypothetical protein